MYLTCSSTGYQFGGGCKENIYKFSLHAYTYITGGKVSGLKADFQSSHEAPRSSLRVHA
jgi:hypothetical protein